MSLIQELEAAKEGSRLLDARIHEDAQPDQSLRAKFERAASRPVADVGMPTIIPDSVPHYTTSLDAALSLVPGGVGFIIGTDGDTHYAQIISELEFECDEGSSCAVHSEAQAASPALALCIAALKARAPEEG